jgi:hypothetical protein
MLRVALRAGLLIGAALLLVGLDVGSAMAASSLGGKLRYGNSITVPAGETVDSDLYAFAATVTVHGTVHGDLVAFGGTVIDDGTVDGDVIAGGGTVEIGGTVRGGVRVAGGQITVSGNVQRDVLAGGGSLALAAGSHVGGDVIFSVGQATFHGTVAGSVQGNAGTYSRTGTLGGTENVTLNQPSGSAQASARSVVLDALRHFVVVMLFGGLALWLLPRGLRAADEIVRRQPLAALGGGVIAVLGVILGLFGLLVAMIALAIAFGLLTFGTLVAIDVVTWLIASAVLTFAFILAAAFVADAVVGLAMGRLVLPDASAGRWQELGALAAGAAVVVIVTSLPLIGPWAKLAVVLIGLGAVVLAGWRRWRGPAPIAEPGGPATPRAV